LTGLPLGELLASMSYVGLWVDSIDDRVAKAGVTSTFVACRTIDFSSFMKRHFVHLPRALGSNGSPPEIGCSSPSLDPKSPRIPRNPIA
jgi:hypothetical protein